MKTRMSFCTLACAGAFFLSACSKDAGIKVSNGTTQSLGTPAINPADPKAADPGASEPNVDPNRPDPEIVIGPSPKLIVPPNPFPELIRDPGTVGDSQPEPHVLPIHSGDDDDPKEQESAAHKPAGADCSKIAAGYDYLCIQVTQIVFGGVADLRNCKSTQKVAAEINLLDERALGALLATMTKVPDRMEVSQIVLAADQGKLYLDGKMVSDIRVPSGKLTFKASNNIRREHTTASKLGYDPKQIRKSIIERGSSGKAYNLSPSNFELVILP